MRGYRLFITVSFEFEGFHSWPGAPSQHAFLGVVHRHLFKCTAKKRVNHDNRDIEFIEFKRKVQAYAASHFFGPHHMSCEMMAVQLIEAFDLASCSVTEDGENGAHVDAIEMPEGM